MEKRILCYTDFSENAQNAIDYAIQLYDKQTCTFYFLNAFQADADASDIEALIPDLENDIYKSEKKTSEAGLNKIIQTIASNSKNNKHSYKMISSYNALLFALKEAIKTNAIDLLVIGAKNALDDQENKNIPTLDIMEYITECSILAVPRDFKFCSLKEIVLPVNYEEVLHETSFLELLNLANLYNSEVQILHIKKEHNLDDNQLENKTKLEHIFKGLTCNFHSLERMNVNKGIISFVENERCNLIAFIGEQSNYIGNDLPKPLLKELDTHLSLPVWLINTIGLK